MKQPFRLEYGASSIPPAAKVRYRDAYFWAGLILLAMFLVQSFMGWKWPWLAELQTREAYKQLSGVALVLVFAHQWRLAALRAQGAAPAIGQAALASHKLWGAMIPLFFYFHAQRWGYAYTALLSAVAFAICGTGLLREKVMRLRKPLLMDAWAIVHVVLSVSLILLVAYHAVISLRY
jgi:hypothetical protein